MEYVHVIVRKGLEILLFRRISHVLQYSVCICLL